MICYAVNRETKEHRRSDGIWQQMKYGTDWKIVQADADGWIPWEGGERPLPDGSAFVYRLCSGETHDGLWATRWRHANMSTDIVAYRPILDERSEREAAEWDGEGLPPVGCECEYDDCQRGWVRTRVLAHHPGGSCAWHESVEGDGFSDYTSYSTDSAGAFRPIRSEADRLTDEALDEIEADGDDKRTIRSTVARMIRAGYRKG